MKKITLALMLLALVGSSSDLCAKGHKGKGHSHKAAKKQQQKQQKQQNNQHAQGGKKK